MIYDYLIEATLALTVTAIPGSAVALTNQPAAGRNIRTCLTNLASG